MRGCLLLFLGVIAGAIGLAAAGALLYGPPPLPPPAPSSYDARIVLSAAFLNRELQTQAARTSTGQPFQNVALRTGDGDLVTVAGTMSARNGAIKAPIKITVRPVARGNRVALQVVRADLGGLPLPSGLFRGLEDSMNRQLSQMLGNSSYRIVGVSTSTEGVSVDLAIT